MSQEIALASLSIALVVAITSLGLLSTGLGIYLTVRLVEARSNGRQWLMALAVPIVGFLLFIGGWVFLDIVLICMVGYPPRKALGSGPGCVPVRRPVAATSRSPPAPLRRSRDVKTSLSVPP
jgi:hypothetical protein